MRFRKSIKLAPGVRINLSRSGVSATFGGRGASVNIGRKGTRATVGIPGTGLSFSQRVGGGSRTGGGGGASTAGSTEAGGCMGMGCVGFLVLALLGWCGDPDNLSSPSYPASTSSYGTSAYGAATETASRDWFYIHGALNVREEPRRNAAMVRTLRHGDYVQLGPKDENGWARLYNLGSGEGYVYRASDLVQRQAPVARSAVSASGGGGSRRSNAASRGYYTGPRGGCYYYSGSGRKQYVDRSNCN